MALNDQLKELNSRIESVRQEAKSAWGEFDQHRKALADAGVDAAANPESEVFQKAEETHKQYSEKADALAVLESQRERLWAMTADNGGVKAAKEAVTEVKDRLGSESITDRLMGGQGYKALVESGVLNSPSARIGNVPLGKAMGREEFKALITGLSDTSGGAFVQNQQLTPVLRAQRASVVRDLITVGQTDSDTVEYARQTAYTNAAAETAESTVVTDGAKPEATIAFEKVTASVKTIAHWVPITKRALSDAGQLRTYVEQILRYGLDKRLEEQIVAGNGVGDNITGITATSGILTQAKGTDSVADAIHKAITQIRLGFNEPNGIALHPNDWEIVRLAKDSTGNYLLGGPGMAAAEQLWGLPVAVSSAVTDDTGIVGDFRQAALWLREGPVVLASDSHSDFFTRNLVALLAEMRAAFGVLDATAFCTVTGLD